MALSGCRAYERQVTDCDALFLLHDKSSNPLVLNLFGATVRYINGADGLHIQTLSGGVKVDLTDPYTNFTYEDVEDAICAANASGGGGEGITPPTGATVTPTLITTSAAGNTTAGVMELSIVNVGAASGTVAGVSFPPTATWTLRGYHDTENAVYNRITSIAYDATGTTFLISELP